MVIGLSPVIAAILLSGLVLGLRPLLDAHQPAISSRPPQKIDVTALTALVERVDTSSAARLLFVDSRHSRFELYDQNHHQLGVFDLKSGVRTSAMPDDQGQRQDVFDKAAGIHNDLGFGLGWLVSLGTFALVLIVSIGPFLSRSAGRGTILEKHSKTGWLLMPLALYLPATLVMMRMDLPRIMPHGNPIPIATALKEAGTQADLTGLVVMQSAPGWTFFTVRGAKPYRLAEGKVTPLKGPIASLGRTLHEGSWGGIWGGLLNAVCALVLLWMMTTGMISWWQRQRKPAELLGALSVSREAETAL